MFSLASPFVVECANDSRAAASRRSMSLWTFARILWRDQSLIVLCLKTAGNSRQGSHAIGATRLPGVLFLRRAERGLLFAAPPEAPCGHWPRDPASFGRRRAAPNRRGPPRTGRYSLPWPRT